MFELERIDHIAITVSDLESSVKWYIENLGLERYYESAWKGVPVMLGKGGTCLAIFESKKLKRTTLKINPHIYGISRSGLTEKILKKRKEF